MNLIKIGIIVLCIVLFNCILSFAQQTHLEALKAEFQKMDLNKDTFVTPKEMQTYRDKRFNELDKDKNGILDKKELVADKTKMFEKADKNKDGKVTKQEADIQFKEYINEMDSDKDGKVSEKEYKEYWPVVVKF